MKLLENDAFLVGIGVLLFLLGIVFDFTWLFIIGFGWLVVTFFIEFNRKPTDDEPDEKPVDDDGNYDDYDTDDDSSDERPIPGDVEGGGHYDDYDTDDDSSDDGSSY